MHLPRSLSRRRVLAFATAIVFCAAIWIFHPRLLRGLADIAITDRACPNAEGIVLYSDKAGASRQRLYDAASESLRANPRRTILIVEPKPHVMEEYGILPMFSAESRRALASRGVAESSLQTLDGAASDVWQAMRLLGNWLQDHPGADAEFYVDRFQSGNMACIAGQVLEPSLAGRVHFHAIPERQFDETNWWKSRDGVKAFMFMYLALAYTRFHGEPEGFASTWNPVTYARELPAADSDP
jgi:hypothetical protein